MVIWRPGCKKKLVSSQRAQAAIELAVFGAVLIFLIGSIVYQGSSASFTQNSNLVSMRMALLQSYNSSQEGNASRNVGTFLLIEDRLSSGAGKYGGIEREPFMSVGSGSMSKNFFLPVDWNEKQNIAVMDMKVNGQRFVLSNGVFVTYRITRNASGNVTIAVPASNCDSCNSSCGTVLNDGSTHQGVFWQEQADRLAAEWTAYGGTTPPFYTTVPLTSGDWISSGDRYFDLNRNNDFTDDPKPPSVVWQWQWKSLSQVASEIDVENGVYPSYDVDGDKVEEIVYGIKDCGGTSYVAKVMDINAGDVDGYRTAEDFADPAHAPGLRPSVQVYTTYGNNMCMEIKEGAVYDLSGNFVRSRSNRDEFDVISRVYQLNKNMVTAAIPETQCEIMSRNPAIEACCSTNEYCCSQSSTALLTCFNAYTKELWIRSRIRDMRGRMFVTENIFP